MAASRIVPYSMIGAGVAMAAINGIVLISWNTHFPELLVAVPHFVLLGIGMLLFPGAEAPPGVEKTKYYWRAAPTSRKAIWIAFGAVGLAIGVFVVHRMGFFSR